MTKKLNILQTKSDWFDELSDEQQKETITHAEAVKLFSKWGLKS
jgi:hypothetical protein